MEIVSVCPLRVSSLYWQPRAGVHALTVVCKATFELQPGHARLSSVQDYPNEEDNRWNDDPARSVYMASDLAPFKPKADVLLVGDAFAPGGQPVQSLTARLTVGAIDKRIEVFSDRHFTAEGELVDGERFTRMPLRWERAAGGSDSVNPVGVDREADPDRFGRRPLPNLQPPGLNVSGPGDVVEPVCFGPVAPDWPTRRRLLGPNASSWSDAGWSEKPFPANLDGGYFNASPLDQRLAEVRPNERLVLEHLHPSEQRLVCHLPGIKPRAFVDRSAAVREVAMRADTLWIDTVRAVCTLTWRGRLEVSNMSEAGRVVVAMDEPGKAAHWAEASRRAADQASGSSPASDPSGPAPSSRAKPAPTMALSALKSVSDIVDESTAVGIIPKPENQPLPFVHSEPASQPPPSVLNPGDQAASSLTSAVPVFSPPGDKSPAWLSGKIDAVSSSDVAPPGLGPSPGSLSRPTAAGANSGPIAPPPPPKSPPLRPAIPHPAPAPATPNAVEPAAADGAQQSAAASPWAAAKPGAAAPAAPAAPSASLSPVPSGPTPAMVPGAASVAPQPPNPAAVTPAAVPDPASQRSAVAAPARAAGSDEIVELLWFSPDGMEKIRENPPWTDIIADLQPEAVDVDPLDFDAEPPPEEPQEVRDQRDIVGVMTRARCIASVDLPRVMLNAVDVSGSFEPPVVMLSGRLVFPFEPLERLKATVTAATPVAAGDKPLSDTLDVINEALQTPWLQSSGEVADGMTEKVRTAFKQANRMVSSDHLDEHVERILLEQRHYQKREIFGDQWIRAQMTVSGSREQVPTYLPAALAKELPMFVSFPARIIAEAHVQQDQYESHDSALKVLALGRVITFTRGY